MRSAFKGDENDDFFDSTYALHRSLSNSTVVHLRMWAGRFCSDLHSSELGRLLAQ